MADQTDAQKVLDRATTVIANLEHAGDALKTALNTTTALARSLANDPTALVAAMNDADARAADWVSAVGQNTPTPLPAPSTTPDQVTPVTTPTDPAPAQVDPSQVDVAPANAPSDPAPASDSSAPATDDSAPRQG